MIIKINKKRKNIVFDADDVLWTNYFMSAINEFLGTNYSENEFEEYYLDMAILDDKQIVEFRKFLLTYDLFSGAILTKDVYEVLEELNKVHNVYICSACVMYGLENNSADFFAQKFNFLINNFPFLDPNKFIFTNDKHILGEIDYQIDDRISNLSENAKNKILYTAYHNKNVSNGELLKNNIIRADSLMDIKNMILNGSKLTK